MGWEAFDLGCFSGAAEPDEFGVSFEENAFIKAKAARCLWNGPILADDSGLEVGALGGEPGVRSARYAGPGADDAANNRLLLERLDGIPFRDRRAGFACALVMIEPDGRTKSFRGEAAGVILEQPVGRGGFGYDPLFLSDDLGMTFAEASPADKNRISHRARALGKLAAYLEAGEDRPLACRALDGVRLAGG